MALAIEEVFCPDVFVSGVDHVERLDGNMIRVVYYAERRDPDGAVVRVVVAKLVRPVVCLEQSMRIMRAVLAQSREPFVAESGETMPLH